MAALRDAGRLSAAVPQRLWPWQSDADGWNDVPAAALELYPQRSVDPGLKGRKPVTVTLRARVDGDRLLLRIAWSDDSEENYSTEHTDRFADALGVQFASTNDGILPYIGMGEPQRPVRLWFWRAGRGTEALTAHGFGTLERDATAGPPEFTARRTDEGWSVILAGPMPASGSPLPLSVAIWDGSEDGRDGRKRFSAWHLLRLPNRPVDADRLDTLSRAVRSDGDPARGERLVRERGCTACHRLPAGTDGPQIEVGPDLSAAGAMHWPGYLRRSIIDPSAFVVPSPAYALENGASKMPDLNLPEKAVADITAYLSSLR